MRGPGGHSMTFYMEKINIKGGVMTSRPDLYIDWFLAVRSSLVHEEKN